MKNKFSFMLKSFLGDLQYAKRLIQSFHKFNKDNIHMFVIVPKDDVKIFQKIENQNNLSILDETSIGLELVTDNSVGGIRPGYINQELIKLGFWETGLSDNYFCIDSDAEFIRHFYIKDFMYDKVTPYSVLVEDKELQVDPEYHYIFWKSRENLLNKIKEFIDFKDPRSLTCHGNTTFNSMVLKSFKKDLLNKKRITYIDVLKISAYEFSWYNFWLQKTNIIPIKVIEPLFKIFHLKQQHTDYINRGITLDDIARGYLGVIINSNYSRGYGVVSYNTKNPYKKKFSHYLKSIKRRFT
jgi:hypothetical protein